MLCFSNRATVEYNGAFNLPVKLDILDVQGRLVQRIELKKRKSRVDLSQLSNGVYFTVVRSENSSTAGRIVKVK